MYFVPATGTINQEEARPGKEYFRVLFHQDVAAISLTNVEDIRSYCFLHIGLVLGLAVLVENMPSDQIAEVLPTTTSEGKCCRPVNLVTETAVAVP